MISPHYDSLIAKVIVVDGNRRLAIERALRALGEFEIEGVPTTRDVLRGHPRAATSSAAASTRRPSSRRPERGCRRWPELEPGARPGGGRLGARERGRAERDRAAGGRVGRRRAAAQGTAAARRRARGRTSARGAAARRRLRPGHPRGLRARCRNASPTRSRGCATSRSRPSTSPSRSSSADEHDQPPRGPPRRRLHALPVGRHRPAARLALRGRGRRRTRSSSRMP